MLPSNGELWADLKNEAKLKGMSNPYKLKTKDIEEIYFRYVNAGAFTPEFMKFTNFR